MSTGGITGEGKITHVKARSCPDRAVVQMPSQHWPLTHGAQLWRLPASFDIGGKTQKLQLVLYLSQIAQKVQTLQTGRAIFMAKSSQNIAPVLQEELLGSSAPFQSPTSPQPCLNPPGLLETRCKLVQSLPTPLTAAPLSSRGFC